jgi:hypothetical protein
MDFTSKGIMPILQQMVVASIYKLVPQETKTNYEGDIKKRGDTVCMNDCNLVCDEVINHNIPTFRAFDFSDYEIRNFAHEIAKEVIHILKQRHAGKWTHFVLGCVGSEYYPHENNIVLSLVYGVKELYVQPKIRKYYRIKGRYYGRNILCKQIS